MFFNIFRLKFTKNISGNKIKQKYSLKEACERDARIRINIHSSGGVVGKLRPKVKLKTIVQGAVSSSPE